MEPDVVTSPAALFDLGGQIKAVAEVLSSFGVIGVVSAMLVLWFAMGRPKLSGMAAMLSQSQNQPPPLTADDVTVLLQSAVSQVQAQQQTTAELPSPDSGPPVSWQEFNNTVRGLNVQAERDRKAHENAHRDMFKEVRRIGEKVDAGFSSVRAQIAQHREESRKMLQEHVQDDSASFEKVGVSLNAMGTTLAVWDERWKNIEKEERRRQGETNS